MEKFCQGVEMIEEKIIDEILKICHYEIMKDYTLNVKMIKQTLKERGIMKKSAIDEAREYYQDIINVIDDNSKKEYVAKDVIKELKNLYEKAYEEK
jgi:hypothetical protein